MKKSNNKDFAILSMLMAVQLVLGVTTYIPTISGLPITFNMIPVAIAAIVLGWKGGAILGGSFGIISFLQCFSIAGTSKLGIEMIGLGANVFLMFLQRFVPRLLDGILLGWIYQLLRKKLNVYISCSITGFFAAFLNTVFFMSALVWIFSGMEKIQSMVAGKTFIAFILASVGGNSLIEMIVSTVLTGAVGAALYRNGYIKN